MAAGSPGPTGLGFPIALPLEQWAALVGAYRWIEQRLFELAGSWVQLTADPETRLHLDLVSGEHGWHAELWEERLPVLDRLDPASLTRPLGPALGPLFAEVHRLDHADRAGQTGTVLRLAILYRVLVPRLLATYERHLRRSVPVSDGPTIRVLRMVVRDELESWQAGETLLERATCTPDDVTLAADTQARLETIVVNARVGAGLVPWPDPPSHGA